MELSAALDAVDQFLGREGLGQIIDRAAFDGVHGQFRGRVASDHQDGNLLPALLDGTEEIITAHSSQAGIGDDHEDFFALKRLVGIFGRGFGNYFIAFIRKHRLERNPHISLIIHNQQWGQSSFHLFFHSLTVSLTVCRTTLGSF